MGLLRLTFFLFYTPLALAVGTEDVDSAAPPPAPMTLSVTTLDGELAGGSELRVHVSGAVPGDSVWFARGSIEEEECPWFLAGGCLGFSDGSDMVRVETVPPNERMVSSMPSSSFSVSKPSVGRTPIPS